MPTDGLLLALCQHVKQVYYSVITLQILLSRCWVVWVLAIVALDLLCFEGGSLPFAGFLPKGLVECGRIGSLHIGKKIVCRSLSWAQASNSGVLSRRVGNLVCIFLLIENFPFIYIFIHLGILTGNSLPVTFPMWQVPQPQFLLLFNLILSLERNQPLPQLCQEKKKWEP